MLCYANCQDTNIPIHPSWYQPRWLGCNDPVSHLKKIARWYQLGTLILYEYPNLLSITNMGLIHAHIDPQMLPPCKS